MDQLIKSAQEYNLFIANNIENQNLLSTLWEMRVNCYNDESNAPPYFMPS